MGWRSTFTLIKVDFGLRIVYRIRHIGIAADAVAWSPYDTARITNSRRPFLLSQFFPFPFPSNQRLYIVVTTFDQYPPTFFIRHRQPISVRRLFIGASLLNCSLHTFANFKHQPGFL